VAKVILSAKGVRPGVYAVVGCGDGTLISTLGSNGINVVLGIDRDAVKVDKTRQALKASGAYGRLSADCVTLDKLPLSTNIVNVVVIPEYERVLQDGCDFAEVARILAPRGVVFVGKGSNADALKAALAKAGLIDIVPVDGAAGWFRADKKVPAAMDDWRQHRYDASRAAISHDSLVGPVSGVQWIQGDLFATSNHKAQSILSMDGRNYYFEFPPDTKLGDHSANLVVRDGFNGTKLWEKKVDLVNGSDCAAVALNGRIYTHLTADGPVTALNGEDGAVEKSFSLRGELAEYNGMLIVHNKPGTWTVVDPSGGGALRSFAVAGEPTKAGAPIVIADNCVFVTEHTTGATADSTHIVCFDFTTAARKWSVPSQGDGTVTTSRAGVVIIKQMGKDRWTDPGVVRAYATDSGRLLWEYPLIEKWGTMTSGVFLDGLYWTFTKDFSKDDQPGGRYVGLDIKTGKIREDKGPAKSSARCSDDLTTDRYILGTDMDLVDKDMNVYMCHIARSTCTAGYIPANGMLYQHEQQCVCGTFIHGILGLSCEAVAALDQLRAAAGPALEKGPAFGTIKAGGAEKAGGWPTYRHDPMRSGVCDAVIAKEPAVAWSVNAGSRITPPVAGDGMVLVAAVDEHAVIALGAADGKERWRFTAGGRVDTPPTVYDGTVLFGSCDGYAYCLNAKDGRLVWRFRAAPQDRRIAVRGQLESKWPVSGAILVNGGLAYFSAGRHTDADGGVYVCAVNPATGAVAWEKTVLGVPPFRTDPNGPHLERVLKVADSLIMGGGFDIAAQNDILLTDGKTLFMGGLGIDLKTREITITPPGLALFGGPGTFLYDNTISTNIERAHWSIIGKDLGSRVRIPTTTTPLMGTSLSLDNERAYGIWPGNSKVEVFAADLGRARGGKVKQWVQWRDEKEVLMKALLVTSDRVFVACAGEGAHPAGDTGASWRLESFSRTDGKPAGSLAVPAGGAPLFDGMAAADGRVFVATQKGVLVCLR
jgi:outer membrane protein assembly factor BamB